LEASDEDLDSSGKTNKSLLHKLKGKFSELTSKEKQNSSSEESGESSADEAAKKKKSLIIKVVVVGALAVVLLYDEIFPPTDDQIPETASSPFKKPIRNKKNPEASTPVPTPEAPAANEANNAAATPSDSTTSEVTPEAVPSEGSATETAESGPVEASSPEESVTTETTTLEKTPESTPETSVVDTSTAPSTETTTETTAQENVVSAEPSTDTVDETVNSTDDENLTDKILQDLETQVKTKKVENEQKEYVAPPDYEFVGRGLVYNCIGKHWACLDGASYKLCETNLASVKYQKKSIECYPFNVYQNQKGCELTQNRMVSSSAKTNFCSEN